jgi:hypothetical protein
LKHFPNQPEELSDNEDEAEISVRDEANQPEAPPEEPNTEEDGFFEVESIQTHKYKQGWRFLTVWKGYGLRDATWEPIKAFIHNDGCLTKAFVDYCESKNLNVPLKNAQDLASRIPVRMATLFCFCDE